ncbi:MAG TPA: hypothetical protein PKO30_15950 [Prolixibacteraceae bacterium]|nr:hypothetical protein [Prolixibacteraceae bacterium]
MIRFLLLFLIIINLISCSYKEISIDKDYKPLPPINYNNFTINKKHKDWALFENGPGYYSLTYITDSTLINTLPKPSNFIEGFDIENYTFTRESKYIILLNKNNFQYITKLDSLKLFLDKIDDISEARFLAESLGYYADESSVFKSDDKGYYLLLFKIVKTGFPFQTDKFLIRITPDCRINILGREVFELKKNVII